MPLITQLRGHVGRGLVAFGTRLVPPPEPDDPDNWLSLDYIHDQVVAQIENQSDVWDAVDARLRLILGVIGIVFAAALGLKAVSGSGNAITYLPAWVGIPAIFAIVVFLWAAWIVARAYEPMEFDWPPNPVGLRNEYLMTDSRRAKLAVIDTINEAYNANLLKIEQKNDAFVYAFRLSAVGTALLGLAIIGQVLSNTSVPSWPLSSQESAHANQTPSSSSTASPQPESEELPPPGQQDAPEAGEGEQ